MNKSRSRTTDLYRYFWNAIARTRLIYISAGLPAVYIVRSILYIYQYTILCYYTTTTTDYYIIYYHQRLVYILKPNNNNILFRYCPDLLACVFTRDRRRPRARVDFAFLRIRFTRSRRGFPLVRCVCKYDFTTIIIMVNITIIICIFIVLSSIYNRPMSSCRV